MIGISGVKTRPAGLTTQVQYNNAGAFGASSNFTYDSATNTVGFGNITGSALAMTIGPKVPTTAQTPLALTLTARSALGGNRRGGGLTLASGAGFGTQRGGDIAITVGGGGAASTGASAVLSLTGAPSTTAASGGSVFAGAGSSVNSAAGEIYVFGGSASGAGPGGSAYLNGGSSTGGGDGGAIVASAGGASGVAGNGGIVAFSAGNSNNGVGGSIVFIAGDGITKGGIRFSITGITGGGDGLLISAIGAAYAIGFHSVTPVLRATTAGPAAAHTSVGGAALQLVDTFDGYTIPQIVKALRDIGILT